MDFIYLYCVLSILFRLGTIHIFALSDSALPVPGGANSQAIQTSSQSAGATVGGSAGSFSGSVPGSDGSGSHNANSALDATNLDATQGTPQSSNKSLGGLSFLRGVLPPAMIPKYAASEWSFAQV